MVDVSVLFITFWLAAPSPAAVATQAFGSITCEFRVFDGGNEISRETRVIVYPSGRSENGLRPDAAGRVSLAPGLYDVQAIRERGGQVAGIRRVEHLLIQRYPDEQGYHLEIINFNAQYGALELKTGGAVEYDAAAFTAGDRTRQVATALRGAGYLLFAVPAGRYDVRVKPAGASTPETWLTDIDVPQGRTRLRTFRPPDARPFGGR
jgi:hypothetical protein